ncbi:MAG: NAD-dependent epimerase/dehydratase family protein [Saprospiraceae bacterium]|uniref:NAD-dependent epimerase/dehydratase family protein n=1 Tax=Candidatus Opimibacter skivensis TaxID=2982028 RepID=A0A9D7XPV9_9BACT|nr:NAD-dependent epimerase/dehydratase family protein [Candidatus Opimibacter skivensis]
MKVAVTGATGHLGAALIRELNNRNYTIRALVRDHPQDWFDDIPIDFINGDLDNRKALHELMMSCDCLMHAAGYISLRGDVDGLVHKTNVEGVKTVMEVAKASGIKRVIHISSIHAYRQKPIFDLLDEHRQKAPINSFAYDNSKREGEEIALSFASDTMDVLVMNPTSFIGPFDYKPSRTGTLIIDLYRGKLPFLIKGGFDFCDVRDIANAVVNSVSMGKNGESYLLSGKWNSLSYIADLISKVSGKKIKPLILPTYIGWLGLPFIYFYGWITKDEPMYTNEALIAISDGNRNISSSKAKRELNFNARPIEETIRDTYEWFLKNGYLG